MERLAAAAAAAIPIVAVAATGERMQPTEWHFLGYPFEAAGMVATIFGCVAARWYWGAGQALRKQHRWSIDIPASGFALACAGGLFIATGGPPIIALLTGGGIGMIGEGLFAIAEKRARGALEGKGEDE